MKTRLAFFSFALSACADPENSLGGTILLGEGVRPQDYGALMIRAIDASASEDPPTTEPHEPVYLGIEPLIEFDRDFPVDVDMVGNELPTTGWLVAWLTDDVTRTWYADDEPHGVALYEMCYCATHSPASSFPFDVVIELP